MTRFAFAFFGVLFFAQLASADVLNVVPGSQNCEGVTIASSATLNVANQQINLTSVGYGLRQKKVVVVNVNVYCATLLVSEPATFARSQDGALASLDKMQAVAIRLDFLRGVDAATVESSFEEALAANNVDTSNPAVKAFLDAVAAGGDAESGKPLTIATDAKAGILLYEDTNGKITQVPANPTLIHQVLSIWLGTPADDGLATLKQQLIGA